MVLPSGEISPRWSSAGLLVRFSPMVPSQKARKISSPPPGTDLPNRNGGPAGGASGTVVDAESTVVVGGVTVVGVGTIMEAGWVVGAVPVVPVQAQPASARMVARNRERQNGRGDLKDINGAAFPGHRIHR